MMLRWGSGRSKGFLPLMPNIARLNSQWTTYSGLSSPAGGGKPETRVRIPTGAPIMLCCFSPSANVGPDADFKAVEAESNGFWAVNGFTGHKVTAVDTPIFLAYFICVYQEVWHFSVTVRAHSSSSMN